MIGEAPVCPKAVDLFAQHVVGVRYEDLPAEAIEQAKHAILDTIGVGVAGATADGGAALLAASRGWGEGSEATVWGRRGRVPAVTAALLNGFQVHCQEFDCLHERAVLHPMAALLPAAMAQAERTGGVSGRDLLVAVVVGVDVAVSLGLAAKTAWRFFRPATAGGFGAAAAVARLAGLDGEGVMNALGIQYGQTSGTMQPHVEGSVVLPMQIGFNARAALHACDLARTGIAAPRDIFEGAYGFLPMFEGEWDLAPFLAELGRVWRITEISHKPYPAGRVTHAGIEGLLALSAEGWFDPGQVDHVTIVGPSLIKRLGGRPPMPAPSANYARICMAFVGAKTLQHGRIDLAHYGGVELADAATYDLAQRIAVEADGNPDPNALAPQEVVVRMKNGDEWRWRCEAMAGNPARPLTGEERLTKFRRCWDFAETPLSAETREQLVAAVDRLEDVADVRELARLLGA